jgi:hypothetical protein
VQCQTVTMGFIAFGVCGRGGLDGYVNDNIPNLNVQECCSVCYNTLNCIFGGIIGDGSCNLYIKAVDDPAVGTTGSATCPHGLTPVVFSPDNSATAFLGPCITQTCP